MINRSVINCPSSIDEGNIAPVAKVRTRSEPIGPPSKPLGTRADRLDSGGRKHRKTRLSAVVGRKGVNTGLMISPVRRLLGVLPIP